MTKSQVKFLLGTPMVPNGFDSATAGITYYDEKKRGKSKATVTRG